MQTLDQTGWLLHLLREAGDEAVTLDELEVVGVRDPAAALRALESAGHDLVRVRDRRHECVRLSRAPAAPAGERRTGPALARPADTSRPAARAVGAAPAVAPQTHWPPRRPVLAGALLLVVALVLAAARR